MNTLNHTIFTQLQALVAGRVHPAETAPNVTEYPLITYRRVGGRPIPTFCPEQTAYNSVVQIECWARTDGVREGVDLAFDLVGQVRNILVNAPTLAWPRSEPTQIRHIETGADGAMMDFSIWWRP